MKKQRRGGPLTMFRSMSSLVVIVTDLYAEMSLFLLPHVSKNVYICWSQKNELTPTWKGASCYELHSLCLCRRIIENLLASIYELKLSSKLSSQLLFWKKSNNIHPPTAATESSRNSNSEFIHSLKKSAFHSKLRVARSLSLSFSQFLSLFSSSLSLSQSLSISISLSLNPPLSL